MVDEKPSGKKNPSPLGGVRAAAELLNGLDPETRKRILENVAQQNPQLASEIKGRLFTFDDLPRLSTWDIQKLLRKVSQQQLALALRNAPLPIKEFIFNNLSARMRQQLEEEIQNLGPRRVSEIEKAQNEIVALAKDLNASIE